jgi:hypothetical protein
MIQHSSLKTIPFQAAAEYLMDDRLYDFSIWFTDIENNYVLVEMSYINAPIQLYSILFDLEVAAYQY